MQAGIFRAGSPGELVCGRVRLRQARTSSARAEGKPASGTRNIRPCPAGIDRASLQQQGHGPVMTPAIPEITQLVEKIAFRFSGYTWIVCISSLLVFRTVTDGACFYPLGHRIGSINPWNFCCDSRVNEKQASNQQIGTGSHLSAVVPYRIISKRYAGACGKALPLPRKFPYHCHQLINCLITLAGFDGALHAAMGMAFQ